MWEPVGGGATATREITVSLPRVEMIATNSPLSPEDGRPSNQVLRYTASMNCCIFTLMTDLSYSFLYKLIFQHLNVIFVCRLECQNFVFQV